MTQPQTNEIVAAIAAARTAGRVVIAVEFPRPRTSGARGPWSILGVDLIYHSWLTDGFNLKLAGAGAFRYDDEFHRFASEPRPCREGVAVSEPTFSEASAALSAEWQRLLGRTVIPALTWGASRLLKVMELARSSQRGKRSR